METPDTVPVDWDAWRRFFAGYGVEVDPSSRFDRGKFVPLASAWVKAGIDTGRMREAIRRALAEAREPIAYLPAYVDRVLAREGPRKADAVAAHNDAAFAAFLDEHQSDERTIDG